MADLRIGGIDPDQGAAVAAGTDRHIAVYQERQAAEHLLLGYARPAADQEPDRGPRVRPRVPPGRERSYPVCLPPSAKAVPSIALRGRLLLDTHVVLWSA